jgi:hypothetical protein
VLQFEVLIFKLCAIDTLTASSIKIGKVATLGDAERYREIKRCYYKAHRFNFWKVCRDGKNLLKATSIMFQCLLGRSSTPSIARVPRTHLNHKVRNDAMKDTSLVVQGFSLLSRSFLARAQGTEVFHSLGHRVTEKTHRDASTFVRPFNLCEKERSHSRDKLNSETLWIGYHDRTSTTRGQI